MKNLALPCNTFSALIVGLSLRMGFFGVLLCFIQLESAKQLVETWVNSNYQQLFKTSMSLEGRVPEL